MDVEEINQRIVDVESNPFPDMDEATYLNKDLWLQVLTGKMDLKMLRCIDWSRNPRYDATPEELYAISPDYINGRKMCYGLGMNKVVNDDLFVPSPDHMIPESLGGSYKINNLVIVPLKYNIWKRDILREDWEAFKTWMDNHLG